jgi:hypothetical protein
MLKKMLLASASLSCALVLLPFTSVGPVSLEGAGGLSVAHAIDIGVGLGGDDDDGGLEVGIGGGDDDDDDEGDDEDEDD